MISVIICSRTASLSDTLTNNISNTIGVAFELVVIDNTGSKYSICEAYNLGVKQSNYSILCFMHDDILYHAPGWGVNVVEHFKAPGVKAIGIAGTPYYPFMPGPWWGSGVVYEHLLQANGDENYALKSNAEGENRKQVKLIDGCWFCIEKNMFKNISFDEKTFSGYHFYDADICMQLTTNGNHIYTVADVLISHSSLGNVNRPWIAGALTFHEKWIRHLPASCLVPNNQPVFAYEYKTLNAFILAAYYNQYSNKQIYKLALKYLFQFRKGYTYIKTPGYIVKFLYKYLFKKGEPFYCF